MKVAGFVLAGGKSSRMGRDKAFLPWEGRTLLDRALEVVGKVAPTVSIVGPLDAFERYSGVVPDVYPGRGPLGGIHAALEATSLEARSDDAAILLAVDMPWITEKLLEHLLGVYLKETKGDSGLLAVVPRLAAGWEPLCAVYSKAFAAVAEEALREGRNAIHLLLDRAGVVAVTEEELAEAGFSARMFRNINTIMDLEALPECPKV